MTLIRPAKLGDSQQLARLHARCFEEAWNADAFTALLPQRRTIVLLANETQEEEASGFVVIRIAADESEILTLGVAPEGRRRGTGTKLVLAAAELAQSEGAAWLFLEVNLNNAAAGKLYRKLGLKQVGTRKGYYRRGAGEDACILKAALPLALSA